MTYKLTGRPKKNGGVINFIGCCCCCDQHRKHYTVKVSPRQKYEQTASKTDQHFIARYFYFPARFILFSDRSELFLNIANYFHRKKTLDQRQILLFFSRKMVDALSRNCIVLIYSQYRI